MVVVVVGVLFDGLRMAVEIAVVVAEFVVEDIGMIDIAVHFVVGIIVEIAVVEMVGRLVV